jgi:hypothetical protein
MEVEWESGRVGPARSTGPWFGYRPICLRDDNFPNTWLDSTSSLQRLIHASLFDVWYISWIIFLSITLSYTRQTPIFLTLIPNPKSTIYNLYFVTGRPADLPPNWSYFYEILLARCDRSSWEINNARHFKTYAGSLILN